jgi:glycosyltransferase involved in cell wall biosynthesis
MKKLIILQTVVPDYRSKVFSYIHEKLKDSFELYGGDLSFEKSIKTDSLIDYRFPVKNHFLFNRKLSFQTGMWNIVANRNIMILEMNPRIISNWVILLIRKSLRRKTILWGHAWPRKGKESKSDMLRNIMRSLGNEIIVYTNTQKIELQNKMRAKIIKTAPNAVYYKKEMMINQKPDFINNIIYVGRLTKGKKVLFLTKAFNYAIKKLPKTVNLIIVGEGEEKFEIQDYIKRHQLTERIKMKGHISDYDSLKNMYDKSLLSISPGYIGLSVTQSFGFGVPMIVSKNERHSPEIEAVRENENALFFETDSIESLSNQIISFFNNKELWIEKRELICEFCKASYSVEKMSEVFIQYIDKKDI